MDMFEVPAVDCVTLCLPTAMPIGMECPELVRVLGTSSKIVLGRFFRLDLESSTMLDMSKAILGLFAAAGVELNTGLY